MTSAIPPGARNRRARPPVPLALLWGLLFLPGSMTRGLATDTNAVIQAWLTSQTNLLTWSADFVQTRSLKTLVRPLVSTGHVWFARPNRFRWELGRPVQTVAARDDDRLQIVYPRLRRVERYALGAAHRGPLGEALGLLDAGFPRDRADFDARFRLLSLTATNGNWRLDLQPASATAIRWIPRIALTLDATTFDLLANEIALPDGSHLRNDFSGGVRNAAIPPGAFRPAVEPGFRVVDLRTDD